MKLNIYKLGMDFYTNDPKLFLSFFDIADIMDVPRDENDKVGVLIEHLKIEENIIALYNRLDEVDKKIVEHIIQYNFHPDDEIVKDIYKSFGLEMGEQYFRKMDPMILLCIRKDYFEKGIIYEPFRPILKNFAEELPIKINALEDQDFLDYDYKFEGNNFYQEIDKMLIYANNKRLLISESTKNLSKNSAVALLKISGLNDYVKDYSRDIIPTIDKCKYFLHFGVLYPLIKILHCSTLLLDNANYFRVNVDECIKYFDSSRVNKGRFLLKKYTDAMMINEFDRCVYRNLAYEPSLMRYNLGRDIIIKYLKLSPINTWIDTNELKREIRIHEYMFLRDKEEDVINTDNFVNLPLDHLEFENKFIDAVLVDYLYPLGIVDVCTSEVFYGETHVKNWICPYYKVTEFGAMVLGLKPATSERVGRQFTVTEDFKIVLKANSPLHNVYLDRFLLKDNEDYLINVKGLSNAVDMGISVKEVREYIYKWAKSVPDNVAEKLELWDQNSKIVNIGEFSVVQMDKRTYKRYIERRIYEATSEDVGDFYVVLKRGKEKAFKEYLISEEKILTVLDQGIKKKK